MDLTLLQRQIQTNCDISDARQAGYYSLCGLLLRLRDLFKWEQALFPWQEPEPAALMEWVDEREARWEKLANQELQPLTLDGRAFDPFDMKAINLLLRPLGLVYGAGYVLGMKPSFFLGELRDSQTVGRLQVDIVGRELARDIYMTPAMRQGEQIFARHSAMLFHLWDQVLEMRPSAREALRFAFRQYDLDADAMRQRPGELAPALQGVASQELATWIHHEIGEGQEGPFNGHIWHQIVSAYAHSLVEIFARVVKDLLADTHPEGLLGHILRHHLSSSLGFFVAFMRPFSTAVFPEIVAAFHIFRQTREWAAIEDARAAGYAKATAWARQLVQIHEAGRKHSPEWTMAEIQSRLINPLGIAGGTNEQPPDEAKGPS